jgi:hypothetical protein
MQELCEALVKTTLSRLEQRQRFFTRTHPQPQLAAALGYDIARLENLFHKAGFERSHFRSRETGSASATGMLRGSRVLMFALSILVVISIGVGLGVKGLFAKPLPPVPQAVVYTPVIAITLSGLSFSGDLNATALGAVVSALPGMASIGGLAVAEYPLTLRLQLSGPQLALSAVGQLALRESLAAALAGAVNGSSISVAVTASYYSLGRRLMQSGPSISSPPPPPPSPGRGAFTCGAGNDAAVCGALGDLYYATGGASWTSRSGWSSAAAGSPTNYCSFSGATCTAGVLTQLCVAPAFEMPPCRKLRVSVMTVDYSRTTR